jgi:hypothetical protein
MVHELVSWTTCLLVVGTFVPFFWSDLRSIWQKRRAAPTLVRI